VQFQIPVSPEILAEVTKLDRFQGAWCSQQSISAERMRAIRKSAFAQSVGASCRLAGVHVTDAQVAALLGGESLDLPDAKDVLGYARALGEDLPAEGELLSGDTLRALHAEMLGGEGPRALSPWREMPLHHEAFDASGHSTGQVFPTLPPRFVERKTEELTTWLELELHSREQHPVLVIGVFLLALLTISPFEQANGRLTRLLGSLLLRRAGYGSIPFASLESLMEETREEGCAGISGSQTHLWTEEIDLEPWLGYFLQVLGRHRDLVEIEMVRERQVRDFPPLQRAIMEAVHEHGSVNAALLLQATGANRNTLKDNLRRMVQGGVLEKIGQRRATRYRMAESGGPDLAPPDVKL